MTLANRVERLVYRPPALRPGEQLLGKSSAVRTTAFPRTYGGRMYVSDRAVYFAPDILNRLGRAKAWCAIRSDIQSVGLGQRRRLVTGQPISELEIVTIDGNAETFTGLSDPDRLVTLLKRMVGS